MAQESKMGIAACLDESLEGVTNTFFEGRKRRKIQFDEAYKAKLIELTEAILSAL